MFSNQRTGVLHSCEYMGDVPYGASLQWSCRPSSSVGRALHL